jgi:hypothetical protein
MKNTIIGVLVGLLFGAVAFGQSAAVFSSNVPSATCTKSVVGGPPLLCIGSDDILITKGNGAAYISIFSLVPVGVVKTVNTISPDVNGNVTVPLPSSTTVIIPAQTVSGTVK